MQKQTSNYIKELQPFIPTIGNVVRLEWHDAYAHSGWFDNLEEIEPMVSYGYFVGETENHIAIALNRGKEQYSNVTMIPKGAIVSCNAVYSHQGS